VIKACSANCDCTRGLLGTVIALAAILSLNSCATVRSKGDTPRTSAMPATTVTSQFVGHTFTGTVGKGVQLQYATAPVTPQADGRPAVYHAGDIAKGKADHLTIEMRSSVLRILSELRPRYRARLSYLFTGPSGGEFLVVFLDGFPQYPALNICEQRPNEKCARSCPLYVEPHTKRVVPSTMPTCADTLPIWQHRG
jgi:hypothetical protein